MTTAYWWRFTHDARSLASELRHNSAAWMHMMRFGGGLSNFGDELSRLAIGEAAGSLPNWKRVDHADVVGIGSILELYLQSSSDAYVWGTGLRSPLVSRAGELQSENVLAVRGHHTRKALGLAETTPVGDPGLLARTMFKARGPKAQAVVLPHFSVFGSSHGRRTIRELALTQNAEIVVPSADTRTVCERISRADIVFTSSLHGLVVADAMGTPAVLVSLRQDREARDKYDDYLSVFGETATWHEPADLAASSVAIEDARDRVERVSPTIDHLIDGLLAAAQPLK